VSVVLTVLAIISAFFVRYRVRRAPVIEKRKLTPEEQEAAVAREEATLAV